MLLSDVIPAIVFPRDVGDEQKMIGAKGQRG
jgi:hypothetical protein